MRALAGKGALALGVSWLIATLIFLATHTLPGDLALQVASSRFIGTPPDAALAAEVRALYGLDRPVWVQYRDWMAQVASLDFGRSLVTGRPVVEELAPYLRNTFVLGVYALTGAVTLAFLFGFFAGRRPGGVIDRIAALFSGILSAVPAFLLGVLLIKLFIVDRSWGTLSGGATVERIALPATVAALGIAAPLLRVVRNAVADVTGSAFYTFAHMRGVPAGRVFFRHGLRNVALPILAYLSTLFVYLVYDLVVIEVVFNYPGIGQALHRAIEARDVPVIQYATLVLVLTYLLLTAIADLVSQMLDPRLSRERKR